VPSLGIELRRTLHARRERVFAAWTRPEILARWMFPGSDWTAVAASDLRVGGKWSVEMREPSGVVHHQFGVYREIEPVSRLVFTWTCPILEVTDSIVTIELTERGERTELLLRHALPDDPKVRSAHEEGWTGCLASLDTLMQGEQQ
jgi:uncharacterized protein YndB with AHSA1/START domain